MVGGILAMNRFIGAIFGMGTQVMFAITIWYLFWFLKGSSILDSQPSPLGLATALGIDALLAISFAAPHSVLLIPSVRRIITSPGLAPFYGCFYCLISCATLLLTIFCWQSTGIIAWYWPAPFDSLVTAAFAASWVALIYSLYLTGLGWQTGWTPWWHWMRGLQQPQRPFIEHGAYRLLRHPVYLSFLGLIWFTPMVTLDRAVLITIWSLYIVVGSIIKDARMLHFIGDTYREYQSRIPGYPGISFGPLGRVRASQTASKNVIEPE